MKILVVTREDADIPATLNETTFKVGKVIKYLKETKDEELLKDTKVERVEIYDDTWVKVFTAGDYMIFDVDKIDWLKTHRYLYCAKYQKEEVEKFWELIKDVDLFKVDEHILNNHILNSRGLDPEVTYNRNHIYVNGKDTGVKFSPETYRFVMDNKQNWY